MPRHQGVWFQLWSHCQICSFTYPIGMLQMQKGSLRCPKCVDDLDIEYRAKIIAEMLADSQETDNEYQHMAEDPQAIIF